MGGAMKCSCRGKMGRGGSCMKCGGYKMAHGGVNDTEAPIFNIDNINTPDYFGEKFKYLTGNLQNTSTQAVLAQQEAEAADAEMHMMPDGSMMPNNMMSVAKHGGNPGMAPYHNLSQADYDMMYNQMYNGGGPTGYPEMFPYAMPYEYREGGIYIKPSKRGTFTAAATKHGKSVQGFASQVLANRGNYSSAMVKKANFARNAASWKKQEGGPQDEQAQIQQLIIQYATMTNSTPEAIIEELKALPEEEQQAALQKMMQTVSASANTNSNNMETAKFGGTRELQKFQGATAGSAYTAPKDQAEFDRLYQARRDKEDLEQYRKYRSTNYSDGYRRNQYNDGYIDRGQSYNYPMGYNQGYGNWPGRFSTTKYKNVNTYYNGMPAGYYGAPQGQGAPQSWSTPGGGWGDVTASRPGLFGGRKYHVSWGTGDRPYTAAPTTPAEKQRSWVGQKLHDIGPNIDKYRTPFPSKKRKEEYEEEEKWKAGQPERDARYAEDERQQKLADELVAQGVPASAQQIEADAIKQQQENDAYEAYIDNIYGTGSIQPPVDTSNLGPIPPIPSTEMGPFNQVNSLTTYDPTTQTSLTPPGSPEKLQWVKDQYLPMLPDRPAPPPYVSPEGQKWWSTNPLERGQELQRQNELENTFPGVNTGMRHGGFYEVDEELDLSPKEIARLKKLGYKFDYI
jgi:hypothetical protein